MTTLKKIKQYLHYLPDKDIILGFKLFEKRDFDSLFDLVSSCIIIYKKRAKEDCLNYTYIPGLIKLKVEIEDYLSYLNIEEEDVIYIDSDNNYETKIENYD